MAYSQFQDENLRKKALDNITGGLQTMQADQDRQKMFDLLGGMQGNAQMNAATDQAVAGLGNQIPPTEQLQAIATPMAVPVASAFPGQQQINQLDRNRKLRAAALGGLNGYGVA